MTLMTLDESVSLLVECKQAKRTGRNTGATESRTSSPRSELDSRLPASGHMQADGRMYPEDHVRQPAWSCAHAGGRFPSG